MEKSEIIIRGAREHNLKNIDVDIPRNKLVVVTGLSGSGKSSLVFDTIYAEGRRRYIESLSAYARQFLGQMQKPEVDYIEGLSPAISIDQKAISRNPRSTVGTVTEIYDYLRVLFARIGKPFCPVGNHPLEAQTIQEMVDFTHSAFASKISIQILAPVVRRRKGEYHQLLNDFYREGFSRAKINGKIYDLSKTIQLERYKVHTIEILVDEFTLPNDLRLAEAIETATQKTDGVVTIIGRDQEITLSSKLACHKHGVSFPEIEPRLFSFNSPYGACPACHGLGTQAEFDSNLVMPDLNKTIAGGGILPWSYSQNNYYGALLNAVCEHYRIDQHQPLKNLRKESKDLLLYGEGYAIRVPVRYYSQARAHRFYLKFEGIISLLERRFRETESEGIREDIMKYMSQNPCPDCGGRRLQLLALAVKIGEKNIAEIAALSVNEAKKFFQNLPLTEREKKVSDRILKEIISRLDFLINVGLNYLTLERTATTLSGGETQRIRLASQIGSGLAGVLYALDEPSIGLHQRDNRRLLDTLLGLRDLGNTVLVIEHDEETIRTADWILDIGPGAGIHGGKIVAQGPIEAIKKEAKSLTGQYLKGEKKIEVPPRRKLTGRYLTVKGCEEHNLKNITVRIPLGLFVSVTGVSGSGKSTLVNDIIYKALANKLNRAMEKPGKYKELEGTEFLDKTIIIDQSPIGRTPRSNPVTYTKAFDYIRQLFAAVPESRARGYKPGRFSFNVPASPKTTSRGGSGGRCERCQGDGVLKIEMHFLPDVYLPCDVCEGRRYNRETLEIKYKGKNIFEVLEMSVEGALGFFQNIPHLRDKLETILDVGLGYIKLGQPATTLSGGEAQRIKLSAELSKRATGKTLYILDEPTTGLHFEDIKKLLEVLNRLVEAGNTVLVIEHNLEVIKVADYIIDLGPGGGEEGGRVIAAGTPEILGGIETSYTGRFLKKRLMLTPG